MNLTEIIKQIIIFTRVMKAFRLAKYIFFGIVRGVFSKDAATAFHLE